MTAQHCCFVLPNPPLVLDCVLGALRPLAIKFVVFAHVAY